MTHTREIGDLPGSFAEQLDTRHNALNFIRLALATAVIVYHAGPIGGFADRIIFGDLGLGHLAVGGFFAISGYLITRSSHRNSLGRFAWHRALRILPGFWMCLFVTAFVIAAIGGLLQGGWSPSAALSYFASNADMVNGNPQVGTTLAGLPFDLTWNGSLWTLRFELLCYIGVGVVAAIGFIRTRPVLLVIAFIAASIAALVLPVGSENVASLLSVVPYFLAGAVLYSYAHAIRAHWIIAALMALTFVALALAGHVATLGAGPVAYLCVWLSIALPSKVKRIGARNDISYGMYLYGFPVQQLLVMLGAAQLGLPAFAVVSIAATLPFAFASWFVLERNVKRLNSYTPAIMNRGTPTPST